MNKIVWFLILCAAIGLFSQIENAQAKLRATAAALFNIVEDLTPQLGGDLDLNNYDITNFSSSGGLIAPLPGRLETAAAFTLEYGDRGSIIYVSTGSDLGPTTTITFSSAANFSQTAGLHDTMLIVNSGAGSIVFQSAGTESIRMSGGAVSGIATQYNQASLIFYDSATVYITGGIE